MVQDTTAKKPEEWDEEPVIDDPNEPGDNRESIPDPKVMKPEFWDDEEDGV